MTRRKLFLMPLIARFIPRSCDEWLAPAIFNGHKELGFYHNHDLKDLRKGSSCHKCGKTPEAIVLSGVKLFTGVEDD